MTSEDVCREVSERSGRICILFFSRGKDAIGSWIQLRRYFDRIVPVFQYLVPNLQFELESLKYYEEFFSQKIIRLPNPHLYSMLSSGLFQTPRTQQIIDEAELEDFDYDDLSRVVIEDESLPEGTYTATGVRMFDSLNRRASIQRYGAINEKRRTFFPVFDWNKERLLTELKQSGVRLPIDYKLFGRTFDGIDYRFLKPLKDNLPEDYNRVIEYFPLAESVIKRMEYRAKWTTK